VQKSFNTFWKFSTCKVCKECSGHSFNDLCIWKWSCLLWSSDAFWRFSACKIYEKCSRRISMMLCIQKQGSLLWCSDPLWKFFTCKMYKKTSGHIFTIDASENKAVCCKNLEVFHL